MMSAEEDDAKASKKLPGPFLGLDIGSRRIGVARADAATRIAVPAETVDATRDARPAQYIAEMIAEYGCNTIVVGWPLTLEGKEGRAVQKVQRFMDRLVKAISVQQLSEQIEGDEGDAVTVSLPDVIHWDERMTTTAAEAFLIGVNVSRRRRKKVVDQIAATHILQGYLDSL